VKEGDEAGRCLFIGYAGGNKTIVLKPVPLKDKGVIKVPNAHVGMNTSGERRSKSLNYQFLGRCICHLLSLWE
jgi:hypothetical protein